MLSVVRKTVSYSRGNVFSLLNPANAVFFFQFLTDMEKKEVNQENSTFSGTKLRSPENLDFYPISGRKQDFRASG